MKTAPLFNDFSGGELSPLMEGRVDLDVYKRGLKTCKNYVATPQGPAIRRPGTEYVGAIKTGTSTARIVAIDAFDAGTGTRRPVILEFGHQYIRGWVDGDTLDTTEATYSGVTAFNYDELADLRFAYDGYWLFIAHPAQYPMALYVGLTSGNITSISVSSLLTVGNPDGPYEDANAGTITLTPSGSSYGASITITASAGVFSSNDVGRLIRMKHGGTWGFVRVTAYTSTTQVTGIVYSALGGTSATTDWRLGFWCEENGYPTCVTLFGGRVWFGGVPANTARMDGSIAGYALGLAGLWAPSDTSGTVSDDSAVSFSVEGGAYTPRIQWAAGTNRGLLIGEEQGEWLLTGAGGALAITPTSIQASQDTARGNADLPPKRIGSSVVAVQNGANKIHELLYSDRIAGYDTVDVGVIGEHLLSAGVAEMELARVPYPVLWFVRTDGYLIGVTYKRETDSIVSAFHQHVLGGDSDGSGTAAAVESLCVIPSSDGSFSQLYMVVKRYINSATVRYIERLTAYFGPSTDVEDGVFLDSCLTTTGSGLTSITGLDHLEGETVQVVGDGIQQDDKTVSSGAITCDSADTVHVGYGYDSDLETLRVDAGATDGTSIGKLRRVDHVALQLYRTNGVQVGKDASNLDTVTLADSGSVYTGVKANVPFEGSTDWDGHIYLRQTGPNPGTILAIVPRMMTRER